MAHPHQHPSTPEAGAAPDLESGIADIFTRLRNAVESGEVAAPESPPVDDGTTFALLGELDRLWRGDA